VKSSRVVLLLMVTAGLVAACAERGPLLQPGGAAATPPERVELRPAGPPQPVPTDALEEGPAFEDVDHGLVTAEVFAVMDRLRAVAGGSPDFGGLAISPDRTRLVLRWYGAVPADVQAEVDASSSGPLGVVVEPALFRPADLQAEVDRLFDAHPGVVTAASVHDGGDGVHLLIREAVVEAAGGVQQALADHGVVSDYPVFAEAGSVVPAGGA
jgi:hypothetical protein